MDNKALKQYLFWAFAIAWALQAAAIHFARTGQMAPFRLVMAVSMFAPFAAVLLARIPLRDMGWSPALRGKLRFFFAAWLVPCLLSVLGAALFYLLFPGCFDLKAGAYLASLETTGVPQSEIERVGVQTLILVQVAAALSYAPFINMLFALGEEVGWRGALYPMLKDRFGIVKGRLFGGLIWGMWHWPVMILAGYNYGTEYFGAPVLGPLVFCLGTVSLGIFFDVLYEKTHCIWIPALAHGAFNAVGSIGTLFLRAGAAPSVLLGPQAIGLIAGIPMYLLGAWLWRKGACSPSTE